jgi:glycosyltransferase involved in cell wall biosynthesis
VPLRGRQRSPDDLGHHSLPQRVREHRGGRRTDPKDGPAQPIIFVDGASSDGTRERIAEEIERYRGEKDIKLIAEDVPKGKVTRSGGVRGRVRDVLMILDADLTVAPEDLPKFSARSSKGRAISSTAAASSTRWSVRPCVF